MSNENKKGTWPQALITFITPIMGVLIFRWLLLEPFVIPSGSMIPTLLVHDHLLVNKLAYGVHFPFTDYWLLKWGKPQKGEIAVFKFPKNPNLFYVKRIVATSDDEIEMKKGVLFINGSAVVQTHARQDWFTGEEDTSEFDYYFENQHPIRYKKNDKEESNFHKIKVPPEHFFVIGDNRDQSYDSRSWGFVPEKYLVGRAGIIWLSCDKTLPSAPFICDPQSIRWFRMFKFVQ